MHGYTWWVIDSVPYGGECVNIANASTANGAAVRELPSRSGPSCVWPDVSRTDRANQHRMLFTPRTCSGGAYCDWLPRVSDRRLGLIYAVLAAVAWSTAGILQRQLHVSAATQVTGRGVFGFVMLAGYAAYTQPETLASVTRRGALLAAGSMAAANSAFIVALNYTSVAHVLVLQSIAPLVAAGLGVVVLGERITSRTACAMAIALGGVVLMMGAPGGGPVFGDGLALLTGVAFALVIVVARRYRGVSMAPAMALAQLLVVIAFAPFAQFSQVSWADVGWLALLGCGQIGLGAIFFVSAARFVPSSEMAMIFLLEVVLGPLWTWIGLSETPSIATLVGGTAVMVGVGTQVGGFGRREDPPGGPQPVLANWCAQCTEHPG